MHFKLIKINVFKELKIRMENFNRENKAMEKNQLETEELKIKISEIKKLQMRLSFMAH